MGKIPKIIHQIWSGIDGPLPEHFKMLGDTWKLNYPDWKYEFWNNVRMNEYIHQFYPQYWNIYSKFPYNVQRWDAIRYLILYKAGGMYVDVDYESLQPIDELIRDKQCCFAQEPPYHCDMVGKNLAFNNALMLSISNHPFMKKIIQYVFSEKTLAVKPIPKAVCVMNTTGPWMLLNQYEHLSAKEKDDVYLIPHKYVTPFNMIQAQQVREGIENEKFEDLLNEAYAVHYYFGEWHNQLT